MKNPLLERFQKLAGIKPLYKENEEETSTEEESPYEGEDVEELKNILSFIQNVITKKC